MGTTIDIDGAAERGQLTDAKPARLSNMKPIRKTWRRFAVAVALVGVLASARVVANPCFRRPVAQFIYFYQQPSGDLNVWERVVYSLLLTKSTEPSS